MKLGNDILLREENIRIDRIMGHGGYFKTKGVGQRFLAAALGTPISVMETAGEGGAWGIALLAAYVVSGQGASLSEWLQEQVFADSMGEEIVPTAEEIAGFNAYMDNYKACLSI